MLIIGMHANIFLLDSPKFAPFRCMWYERQVSHRFMCYSKQPWAVGAPGESFLLAISSMPGLTTTKSLLLTVC